MLTSQILDLIAIVCGVVMYVVLSVTLLRAGKALGEHSERKTIAGTCRILGYLGILFAIARASYLPLLLWQILA
jgi:hypothetical protein